MQKKGFIWGITDVSILSFRRPIIYVESIAKLVELVRILEERAYIFPGDPVQATEALRHIDGGNEEKLIRRAQIIDRDQHLKYVLQQVETGSFWLWIVAATLLFTVGFSSTYLLMDNQGLNFFWYWPGFWA